MSLCYRVSYLCDQQELTAVSKWCSLLCAQHVSMHTASHRSNGVMSLSSIFNVLLLHRYPHSTITVGRWSCILKTEPKCNPIMQMLQLLSCGCARDHGPLRGQHTIFFGTWADQIWSPAAQGNHMVTALPWKRLDSCATSCESANKHKINMTETNRHIS